MIPDETAQIYIFFALGIFIIVLMLPYLIEGYKKFRDEK